MDENIQNIFIPITCVILFVGIVYYCIRCRRQLAEEAEQQGRATGNNNNNPGNTNNSNVFGFPPDAHVSGNETVHASMNPNFGPAYDSNNNQMIPGMSVPTTGFPIYYGGISGSNDNNNNFPQGYDYQYTNNDANPPPPPATDIPGFATFPSYE